MWKYVKLVCRHAPYQAYSSVIHLKTFSTFISSCDLLFSCFVLVHLSKRFSLIEIYLSFSRCYLTPMKLNIFHGINWIPLIGLELFVIDVSRKVIFTVNKKTTFRRETYAQCTPPITRGSQNIFALLLNEAEPIKHVQPPCSARVVGQFLLKGARLEDSMGLPQWFFA